MSFPQYHQIASPTILMTNGPALLTFGPSHARSAPPKVEIWERVAEEPEPDDARGRCHGRSNYHVGIWARARASARSPARSGYLRSRQAARSRRRRWQGNPRVQEGEW